MNDPFDGKLTGDTAILRVRVRELESENDKLRGLLAAGKGDCVYCGLPAADIDKCPSGHPGCARMRDVINAPETKKDVQIHELTTQLREIINRDTMLRSIVENVRKALEATDGPKG